MCTFAPLLLFKHTNPIIDQWQQHSKVTVGEKDHLYPVSFNCVTSLSPSLSVPKECQVIMLIFLTGFSDFFWLFPKHQYNSFYMSFLNSICSIILDLQCVWCRVSWRKNKLKELSKSGGLHAWCHIRANGLCCCKSCKWHGSTLKSFYWTLSGDMLLSDTALWSLLSRERCFQEPFPLHTREASMVTGKPTFRGEEIACYFADFNEKTF